MGKAGTARRDIEAEVTARVIEALERGTVPWEKPWRSAGGLLPTSVSTGRPYRGINTWLLTIAAETAGYSSPYWLTFKQAQEHGGTIRAGEKGTLVVFWKLLEVRDAEAIEPDAKKRIPLLRHYTVFNVEQTDGLELPARFTTQLDELEPVEPGAAVAAVLAGYIDGPSLRHVAGDRAYYAPAADTITLPALEQFPEPVGYSSTLFHELTHSTGHESRLDRFERGGEPQHFGSERYAREELVAEMGAAILAATAGTEHRLERSAAYVANWLKALKDDKSLVTKAAQQAQKAVDRITGEQVAA